MDAGTNQGRRRAAALMTLMSVLASQWLRAGALLSPQQLGEHQGAHAIVFSPAGFVEALSNALVFRVHVTENLFMSEDTWPPHVIRIARNLTIESAEDDQRLINFSRVLGKVVVDPGVHLRFNNVIMAGLSIGSSIMFIAASPGAIVSMRGGAWKAPVCPPYGSKMLSLMITHPRPPGYPGHQSLGPTSRPFCINHVCYQHVFEIHDWASSQPLERDEFELGAYTALFSSITWACDVVFTDKCVALKGYDICRKEMLSLHLRGMSDTYTHRWRTVIVALAAVVAIVAITAGTGLSLQHLMGAHRPLQSSKSRSGRFARPSHQPLATHGSNGSYNNVQLGPLLGSGSYGSVFQGSWQGRVVAVKVISHDRQSDKQIHTEAAVSSTAVHPNVVRTFHHFTLDEGDEWRGSLDIQERLTEASKTAAQSRFSLFSGQSNAALSVNTMYIKGQSRRTWMVLELCDHGTLLDHLENEASLDPHGHIDDVLALGYALDVALGMAYLHERSICHGDLKAGNTLVMSSQAPGARPVCKISDFGLSRVLAADSSHLCTNTIGTITHMPPELLLDGVLTKECDVYSYGILLWEIASGGQGMYAKMNPAQIIQKVVVKNERPEFAPHVPQDYVHLAGDCWQANVYARPSFTEVAMRLQGMLQRTASSRARVPRSRSKQAKRGS